MLTVGVKIFPHAADAVIQPMSGLVRQADTATSNNKTSIADALDGLGNNTDSSNSTPGDAWTVGNSTTNNSNNTSSGVTTDQFNQLNSLVNSLQSQVNADNLNIAQLNVSLNQANNKNDELNTKLNNALANQTANNNSASSDLINQIKAKNDALYSQLNSMNQSYQSQGQQYANQIQALQQQLASVQSNQNDNNQNAASNSALTTQLAQQLSSAQSALQQLAATVTANNTQAQNLFSQYQAQIDQANQNSTDAENTANQANAQTQVNAGNISANSQAANNAQQTADSASSAANAASASASNAANAASSAQTAATNAQNAINKIFQSRSHVFDNGESLTNAASMQDGYYVVKSATNTPSNFTGSGMLSVYHTNDNHTYMVLTDANTNTVWTSNITQGTATTPASWNYWTQQAKSSDVAANTNLINNIQQQLNAQTSSISQLQNDDIYKVSYLNASSDLSTLKTPGTYVYNPGWGGAPRIDQLAGAGNLSALLQSMPGFDPGYATVIVSPQLGTWQTQTIVGASGYTIIRSMNNGQNFDSNIDGRCLWHIVSGADTTTMMYKGDITNQDINQWFQTGIYKINGPVANSPSGDWLGSLVVVNDGNTSTQELTTQDSSSPNQTQRWFRRANNGQWGGWQRADGGVEYAQLTKNNSLLDPATQNWPDGLYKVYGVSRDTPWNTPNRYGMVVKHTAGPDVTLTYYDAWWNGIYINYKTVSGWQGWREATN